MDALAEGTRLPTMGADAARRCTLFLASKSPRRAELLRRHGFAFEPVSPGIDDALLVKGSVTPEQWVAALAHLKARGGAATLGARASEGVVLGSDTVVVKNDRVIGQPTDEDDARRIIESLQRGEHTVVTGVALLFPRRGRLLFTDAARVKVGDIGPKRIADYVASGEWRGKAGAYNLEERIADGWPIEYRGDPGTIMGLPMRRLAPVLERALATTGAHP
jgi:septum formation protein